MNTRRSAWVLLLLVTLACTQLASPVALSPQPATPTQFAALTQPPAAESNPTGTPTQSVVVEPIKYGKIARAHIATITDQFGARWSGTEEEKQTGHYIEEAFAKIGYEPEVKSFSRMGWEDDDTQAMFDSANVMAVKEGKSAQVIVVGAHYDSSDEGLGADDNASGIGVLLELAQVLKDVPTPDTIHFVAFGAEEAGLLGSVDYVANLSTAEKQNTIGFINIDSISAGDIMYVYCQEDKPALRDWAMNWSKANGYELQTIHNVNLSDDGYATADYDAFQQVGIPFVYFESTNWNLGDKDGYTQVGPQYGDSGAIIHTQYDTLDYIDKAFPSRVNERLNSVIQIVYAILTHYGD